MWGPGIWRSVRGSGEGWGLEIRRKGAAAGSGLASGIVINNGEAQGCGIIALIRTKTGGHGQGRGHFWSWGQSWAGLIVDPVAMESGCLMRTI